MNQLLTTVKRRIKRMRRRQKVGRAYDMALEISGFLKSGDRVLDVGCGNGFIAHHLSGLLGGSVVGLDICATTSAQIDFLPYDGQNFPVLEQSFDAVLLCYVLHHAGDAFAVLNEAHRVLRPEGIVIVYEDNPSRWWDKAVCWLHNKQWKSRTGQCTFKMGHGWSRTFRDSGFTVISERSLSRWRNLSHPVARNFFVLKAQLPSAQMLNMSRLESWVQSNHRAA